jgi:hypothetical protein
MRYFFSVGVEIAQDEQDEPLFCRWPGIVQPICSADQATNSRAGTGTVPDHFVTLFALILRE